jgi:hypothetical protein
MMVYGELGVTSVSELIDNRMVNFCAKLVNSKKIQISHIVYKLLFNMFKKVYQSPLLIKGPQTVCYINMIISQIRYYQPLETNSTVGEVSFCCYTKARYMLQTVSTFVNITSCPKSQTMFDTK